jgi:hypothetical protein
MILKVPYSELIQLRPTSIPTLISSKRTEDNSIELPLRKDHHSSLRTDDFWTKIVMMMNTQLERRLKEA